MRRSRVRSPSAPPIFSVTCASFLDEPVSSWGHTWGILLVRPGGALSHFVSVSPMRDVDVLLDLREALVPGELVGLCPDPANGGRVWAVHHQAQQFGLSRTSFAANLMPCARWLAVS